MTSSQPDLRAMLLGSAVAAARALLGARLTVDGVGGIIVETEAYDQEDPASHSHRGESARNRSMFAPAGTVYVYRSYGIHWCLNVATGPAGIGAAVLIRALEPAFGIEAMARRRRCADLRRLCAGPGRLCEALGITGAHDGADIARPPFALEPPGAPPPLVAGPRIGITRGVDRPWRFGLAGSPFLSRPFPTDHSAAARVAT